ncbi:hypothetical protein D3C84_774690 [compost metagenome]
MIAHHLEHAPTGSLDGGGSVQGHGGLQAGPFGRATLVAAALGVAQGRIQACHAVGFGFPLVLGQLLEKHMALEQDARALAFVEPFTCGFDLGEGGEFGQLDAELFSSVLQIGDGELVAHGCTAQGCQGAGPCLSDDDDQVIALEGEHGLLCGTAKPAIICHFVASPGEQLLQFCHRCTDGAFFEGHG